MSISYNMNHVYGISYFKTVLPPFPICFFFILTLDIDCNDLIRYEVAYVVSLTFPQYVLGFGVFCFFVSFERK